MSKLNENHAKKIFHWKGKRVTEKKYKKNLQQVALAKKLNKKHQKSTSPNPTDNYGRRIIHLQTLGNNMICKHCELLLSLTDLVSEKRIGLASILYLKCRKCNKITFVSFVLKNVCL